jgi:hypothetical protein
MKEKWQDVGRNIAKKKLNVILRIYQLVRPFMVALILVQNGNISVFQTTQFCCHRYV